MSLFDNGESEQKTKLDDALAAEKVRLRHRKTS
jgi:hypothetical protein